MRSLIKDIIIALLVVLVITFFIKPILVKKTSMLPTLEENDYILISKQAYNFGTPEQGDIIVFKVKDKNEFYIKRVIGLPNQEVDIENGTVYINNKALNEDYTLNGVTPGRVKDFTVPEGSLYVLGDNRENSVDSRDIGPIKIDDVAGKVIIRLYPFSKFGTIR